MWGAAPGFQIAISPRTAYIHPISIFETRGVSRFVTPT
jgi:hypothetical protein